MEGLPRQVLEKLLIKCKKNMNDFVETVMPDEDDDLDLIEEEEEESDADSE